MTLLTLRVVILATWGLAAGESATSAPEDAANASVLAAKTVAPSNQTVNEAEAREVAAPPVATIKRKIIRENASQEPTVGENVNGGALYTVQ